MIRFVSAMPRVLTGVLVLGFVAACVTVNIYFPAAEVEQAAEEIVSDVYGDNGQGEVPAGDAAQPVPGPSSMLRKAVAGALGALGPAEAHAQSATTVSNAAIRGLKSKIAANHRKLAPFYNKGNVGITNQGTLNIRSQDGLSVAQVGTLRRLVSEDNKLRKQLYAEVAKALKVDPSQTSRIQSIFAKQWQGQARSGWWVQNPKGKWARK